MDDFDWEKNRKIKDPLEGNQYLPIVSYARAAAVPFGLVAASHLYDYAVTPTKIRKKRKTTFPLLGFQARKKKSRSRRGVPFSRRMSRRRRTRRRS